MNAKLEGVSINREQGVFVIEAPGGGYSCIGFDVLMNRARKLAVELGMSFTATRGTLQAYREYRQLVRIAQAKHQATGWRSQSELTPCLIGHEGQRVEVEHEWGEVSRFWVGRSTGFIPCHLAIARRNCRGGPAVAGVKRLVRVVSTERRTS